MTLLDVPVLTGMPRQAAPTARFQIVEAGEPELAAYRRLRRAAFVDEQGIFAGNDHDRVDDDPRTIVLVAVAEGVVVGGVRLAPAVEGRDIGWWTGSRLVVDAGSRGRAGIGSALVRDRKSVV